MSRYMTKPKQITCVECGKQEMRRGGFIKYCRGCSEAKSNERKAAWLVANRDKHRAYNREMARGTSALRKSSVIEAGMRISERTSISFEEPNPQYRWIVRLSVPYTTAASKNHIFGMGHHVFKRKESREFQDALVLATKAAVRDIEIFENKIWLGIHVEKRDHKSDGVNYLDLICDAVKYGVGVDDRWFSIAFMDWSINKNNPSIHIQIGQEAVEPARACSHCGRILTFEHFGKKANDKMGIARACKECRSLGAKIKRGSHK